MSYTLNDDDDDDSYSGAATNSTSASDIWAESLASRQ
jgi:hypothetical protein